MKRTLFSKRVLHKILYIAVAFSLLLTIFNVTSPDKVSLAVLLIPFLLIGFIVFQVTDVILGFDSRKIGKVAVKKLVALSLSFAVVSLLLLASLGQLTVRDGLLVVGFVLVFLFYIARADFLDDRNSS